MSAYYSEPAPGPGAREPRQPDEVENRSTNGNWQIDPQQQFREYPTPGGWPAPGAPSQPAYPAPGAYPGQITGVPGQTASYPGPGYPPNAGYPAPMPGAQGYYPYPGYPGYPGYGYPWPPLPPQPKRDTYTLVVGIVAFACSCLVILGGLASVAFIGLFSIESISSALGNDTYFAAVMLFLTFALAGIVGGSFCMYHSIRSLFFQKASARIWLPRFWIFLLCYLVTLGLGFWLHTQGLDVAAPVLTGLLIYLGGIFPALTIMALGIRRLSFRKADPQPGLLRASKISQWPTSWRRLTLALVSGATLSVVLAAILELVFELIMLGSQSGVITQYLNNPNAGNPPPSIYGMLLILLSVIAPLVEETVKPLAVVVLIGRVSSKAEAFTLGLACGIGFNLVETTGYISSGYNGWLTVALMRSGAGLLHGFGAAMVALGWYYLTHHEEGRFAKRLWLALGCAGYAVLQHAIWNGSVALAFIPGPIGDFFQNWSWSLGPVSIDGVELANIVEVIGILIFFMYMAGRLRRKPVAPPAATGDIQPAEGPPSVAPAW